MIEQLFNAVGTELEVQAILADMKPLEFSKQKGTPFQNCILTEGGMTYKVKIYKGNNNALTPDMIGLTWTFKLKSYTSNYDNKTYLSGFWQAPRPQAPTQAPPPGPAKNYGPVQQARQALNQNKPGTDEYALAIQARGWAIRAASNILDADTQPEDIVIIAKRFFDWIMTGKSGPTPVEAEPMEAEPEPQSDDIPF